MSGQITEERLRLSVRRVFTLRRKQFGNFPYFPLKQLAVAVIHDLKMEHADRPSLTQPYAGACCQPHYDQVKEYILDNLDISAALPPE